MFLFQKKSTVNTAQFEYFLHTGDFRAAKEMLACPQLQSLSISQLFLDTTYVCTSCHMQFVIVSLQLVHSAEELAVKWLEFMWLLSLPRISRPPKNRVHMLSKIIDPSISRRYSKLTTCCIIVRILGGFYDSQLKCNAASYDDCFLLDAVAISDRYDYNWLGLHGPL